MAKSVMLFINAFSIKNQDRYKDTPANAARFANLTESDLILSNYALTGNKGSFTVKSLTRSFQGNNQTYTRAKLQNPKVTTYTELALDGVTDQASFMEAIKHIETAGVYQVAVPELNGESALLVIYPDLPEGTTEAERPELEEAAVFDTLTDALLFTFEDDKTITRDGNVLRLTDRFINDTVYYAEVGQAFLEVPDTDYGELDSTAFPAEGG